ncbi:hypothetical protein PVK06_036120 [Gossypium arboreum]|uniref:Uncharacterized protein n=1 Tax=Gossypium arboreum TaxID=29729 RepID=A0ABR0NIM8_GOSAR|nr:hypothetical protein PVK06_036120 [Gossypium arboreum]
MLSSLWVGSNWDEITCDKVGSITNLSRTGYGLRLKVICMGQYLMSYGSLNLSLNLCCVRIISLVQSQLPLEI